MGVSENRGSKYGTLNSRVLIIKRAETPIWGLRLGASLELKMKGGLGDGPVNNSSSVTRVPGLRDFTV